MIIDTHTHIGNFSDRANSKERKTQLEKLLKETQDTNVSHLIVIAGFQENDLWSGTTEEIIEVTRTFSNISVVGSIDVLKYTQTQLQQLEQWLQEKTIVGVKIYTGYQHMYPNNERCQPIYTLCLKYNVPVIFHSGDTLAGYTKNPKVKFAHPLHIDEVAADFPKLKIIIAHMGNPWLIDCAEVLYKNPNVYADISGLVVNDKDLISPYGELMKKRIKELLIYTGTNKLLYGTDYPLCSEKTYLKFVQGIGLSQDDIDSLLYKNAQKLFNL